MASNRTLNKTGRPKLFSPSVIREEAKYSISSPVTLKSFSDTNSDSTSSFRYENPGMGVKSTQEIPLDWSKFQNHTFFNSAQSKVNIAFDRIINEYPFNGTEREVEAFEDSLTGYEKYILDIFPKSNGFLLLSGTTVQENPAGGFSSGLGTFIKVYDSAGSQFPAFSKKNDGSSVIDFSTNPFSFEFLFRPPKEENDCQIIFQKRKSRDFSVTVALSSSLSSTNADLIFSVNSGSARLITSSSIEKGVFSHICATYDRDSTRALLLYVSESLVSSSSRAYEMDTLSFSRAPLFIGSGSLFDVPSYFDHGGGGTRGAPFNPKQTLSGAIDETRVFHSTRAISDQLLYGKKSIYASDELKLYFKFNEPTGSFNIEDVVLDSSGNSLNSRISNFFLYLNNENRGTGGLRATGSYDNYMTAENIDRCPVLFPSFSPVSNLNLSILSTAVTYDEQNPNLVTKLIPVHYLLEGQSEQGFQTQDGNIGQAVTANSIPGSAKIGSAQYLTAFLLMWSKFFDEIKIFIDHFSDLIHPSYDDYETVASKFLPFVASYYGIDLPPMFPDTDVSQYVEGENIEDSYSRSQRSLAQVQTEIWRRILINLNDIIQSKGTIYSIRSFLLSAGINPDNLMNIREYGGPTKRSLTGLRETKSEVAASIDFSGSFANVSAGALTPKGFSTKFPHIVSPFLSSSRVEVGYPEPQGGSFVQKDSYFPHGIYNNPAAGWLTSGSFTYEAIYQFSPSRTGLYSPIQSLARLQISGSNVSHPGKAFNYGTAVTNLIIISGTVNSLSSSGSTLRLYARPGTNASGNRPALLKIDIEGPNFFDGNLWNISFGRMRGDQKVPADETNYISTTVSSIASSSYFLRCSRQSHGEIKESYSKSLFFIESANAAVANRNRNIFSPKSTDTEFSTYPSGTIIVIGSQSMSTFATPTSFLVPGPAFSIYQDFFLNDTSLDTRVGASAGDRDIALTTDFQGQVSQIRFWSKALEEKNWLEHVRNFKSMGVTDPRVNFNFDTYPTGSFERMRVDASIDQFETESNSDGDIELVDFSQNNLNMIGSGFESEKGVIKPETFYFSQLSPKFDQAQTDNKVRIRSFQTADLIDLYPYATSAPSFEVLRSEEPFDDTRFSIEFSSVKSLDNDIMNIFGTLEFFNNALGNTNLLFDDFYPDIDQVRKIYFKRLTEKPDYQIFFDMYKWFNSALGILVHQLIPRKTKFLGINFVIESHVLERNRFRYLFDDIYLLSLERNSDRGNLFLSQFVGSISKF